MCIPISLNCTRCGLSNVQCFLQWFGQEGVGAEGSIHSCALILVHFCNAERFNIAQGMFFVHLFSGAVGGENTHSSTTSLPTSGAAKWCTNEPSALQQCPY